LLTLLEVLAILLPALAKLLPFGGIDRPKSALTVVALRQLT
jgi:hypothetical protein